MSRYARAFADLRRRGEGALVPFVTLGDPSFEQSKKILEAVICAGADMLEVGLPFSDPIADGPSIQAASARALEAGMTPPLAFELLQQVRERHPDLPIGLLVYANLTLACGLEAFYRSAQAAGVDSVLVADLPLEEAGPWLEAASQYGIDQVFLVSLTTDARRMEKIAAASSGYVYLVAVLGVTGAREELQQRTVDKLKALRAATDKPICVGFGISQPRQMHALLSAGADGVVVGSALVDRIERNLSDHHAMLAEVKDFLAQFKFL
ncbi:MAG TPA: tryptophan synthase subunit alpha [Candidatus Bipolaricaulota bacterium]